MEFSLDLPEIPLFKSYMQAKTGKGRDNINGVQLQVRLTKNEAKILELLLERKGQMVERSESIEKIWGEKGLEISDHAYDQLIHRLKIKLNGSSPKLEINTIKGRGHTISILK